MLCEDSGMIVFINNQGELTHRCLIFLHGLIGSIQLMTKPRYDYLINLSPTNLMNARIG
jgi:hypothetical protein